MRKLYFLLFLAFGLIIEPVFAQNGPSWAWAVNNNFVGTSYTSLTTDSAGNVYTAGSKLSKHDAAGNLVWSRILMDTSQMVEARGLASDAAGNLYLTGFFFGNAKLDTATLKPIGHTDIFIAKFNANGQVLWAKSIGGPGPGPGFPPSPGQLWDAAWAIAADSVGNCYITGICENAVQFDTIMTDPTKTIKFITKFNKNGKTEWVREIPTEAYSIAVDRNGNYFITGGPGTFSIPGGTYTTKYDANGNIVWKKVGVNPGNHYGKGLTIDKYGNCIVTGITYSSVTFDNVTIIPDPNKSSMFLLKYNVSGALLWARQTTGSSCEGLAVTTDGHGNAYVTGGMTESVNFSPTVQLNSVNVAWQDIYTAKYTTGGNLEWAIRAGSGGLDYGQAIGALPNGDVYVAGSHQNGCAFGNISLGGSNSNNFFLAKLTSIPLSATKDIMKSDFQLYPNPANSEVIISGVNIGLGTLTVFNLTGQTIYESQIDAEMKVNVAYWPAGVYAVKLTSGNKTITRKLVVTH